MSDGTAPSLNLWDFKNKIRLGSIGSGPFEVSVVEAHLKDATVIWGVAMATPSEKELTVEKRATKVGLTINGKAKFVPIKDGLYVSNEPKDAKLENIWYLDDNDNLVGIYHIQVMGPIRYFKYVPEG